MAGKTLANLANPEQFAKVLPIQIDKLREDSMMNEYQANSEHAWKLQTIAKSTWTPFNHHYSHRL